MKFFDIIPLSNFQPVNSAYPYGVPDILVPFHRLYFLYSMLRTRWPRNVFPNTAFPIPGILSAALWMFSPLIALLSYLYSMMVDIRYAYGHDPYSQLPLESSHFHYYRSEQANRDTVSERPLLTHDNDISSPIRYEHLANLQYVNSFAFLPYCKVRAFIETKVAAINCGDLTLN